MLTVSCEEGLSSFVTQKRYKLRLVSGNEVAESAGFETLCVDAVQLLVQADLKLCV